MVSYRPLQPHELRAATRFVLEPPDGDDGMLDDRVRAFEHYVASARLDAARQWGAFRDGRLIAASLCIVSPGRTAILFLPAERRLAEEPVFHNLLGHVVRDAGSRGVQIVQALVPPQAEREQSILADAGFTFLAELIYMQRSAGRIFDNAPAETDISWLTHAPEREELFASTLAGTYEESLDCPGLAGLRTIEDILASHKAAGEFQPRHWLVASVRGEPAGVLLMARLPGRDVLDVVYMGVRPAYRRRGVGRVLLHKAVKVARESGRSWITLAVDASNEPALQLYRRCGFEETGRRRAWIAATARLGA